MNRLKKRIRSLFYLIRLIKNWLVTFFCKCIFLFRIDKFLTFFVTEYKQIVICGIPRSGTSLIFNLLNSALIDFNAYVGKNKNKKSKEISGLNVIFKLDNYLTKRPDDVFKVKDFERRNIFQKSIIIFVIIRDFRDVITSKHQWGDGSYYLSYNYKKAITNRILSDRGLKDYLKELEYLKMHVNNFKNVNIVFLDYSDIVDNPAFLIDVLNENNLPNKGYNYLEGFDSVYDKSEKSSKGVKKIKNKWMDVDHKKRIIDEFTNNPDLFDYLVKYRYEKNNDWYFELIDEKI